MAEVASSARFRGIPTSGNCGHVLGFRVEGLGFIGFRDFELERSERGLGELLLKRFGCMVSGSLIPCQDCSKYPMVKCCTALGTRKGSTLNPTVHDCPR